MHHECCSGPCRACRCPQGAEHPQPGTEGAGDRVGLGVLLPQPQLQVSAGDKAATEGGSIPLQVPLSPGAWCCQAGADPGLQQHWGEWQCWRSPGLPTQPQGGPGTAPECGPCGCARERGGASVVPPSGLCSCRAQLQWGRAGATVPASPGSFKQLPARSNDPVHGPEPPQHSCKARDWGVPCPRAGRWSLGIYQDPLAELCHPSTAVPCSH